MKHCDETNADQNILDSEFDLSGLSDNQLDQLILNLDRSDYYLLRIPKTGDVVALMQYLRREQPRFMGGSFFAGLKSLVMGPARIYASGREKLGAHHMALAYVNLTDDNWEVFDSMRKHEGEGDSFLINRIVMEAINKRRAKRPVKDLNNLPEFLSDSYKERMNG